MQHATVTAKCRLHRFQHTITIWLPCKTTGVFGSVIVLCTTRFVAHFEERQLHALVSAHQGNQKAYTAQIAPSLRQAPHQPIAAQIQLLQLHQRTEFQDMQAFCVKADDRQQCLNKYEGKAFQFAKCFGILRLRSECGQCMQCHDPMCMPSTLPVAEGCTLAIGCYPQVSETFCMMQQL